MASCIFCGVTWAEGPDSDPEWEKMFKASLKRHCSDIKKAPGQAPVPVKLGGWPALQVPACCVTGLVLLGEGNTRSRGKHKSTLRKITQYVRDMAKMEHPAMKSHESWMLAFATLYLSELHRVNPSKSLKKDIEALVKRLESGQQGEKGWHHELKPSGRNYGPFTICTAWCTAGLASAKEQGVKINQKALDQALSGLKKSIGQSGGSFYFTTKQHGRSYPASLARGCGAAWVLERFTKDSAEVTKRTRALLVKHPEIAPDGHGTWMMHFGTVAMTCCFWDKEAQDAFWKVHRQTLLTQRSSTGRFAPRKWTEKGIIDGTGRIKDLGDRNNWPDPMYGDSWATSWMLFAMQCSLGRNVLVNGRTNVEPSAESPDK